MKGKVAFFFFFNFCSRFNKITAEKGMAKWGWRFTVLAPSPGKKFLKKKKNFTGWHRVCIQTTFELQRGFSHFTEPPRAPLSPKQSGSVSAVARLTEPLTGASQPPSHAGLEAVPREPSRPLGWPRAWKSHGPGQPEPECHSGLCTPGKSPYRLEWGEWGGHSGSLTRVWCFLSWSIFRNTV